ncbi:ABC transporter permease [Pacificoceanicola onchidii]|uniref:ABC transporter permease n=1 Tax=Pacificoceanicola onchidii TaxID=2562685 RepID=UPI0010A4A158|nr:ABC transporter permease subunit [Pacificoceanicola onchidii]
MSIHAGTGAEQRIVDDRDVSVEAFVVEKADYYTPIFELLQRGKLPRWHMNIWGLLLPWFWAAMRGTWIMFWIALALDVLAIVCLMQVVKFSPLLAEAQANAADNVTLIARYSGWIQSFGTVGVIALIAGRLWMGSSANRFYYGQYTRWRTDKGVANGVNMRRVILAAVIIALVAPLTIYRASQQRLDERACLNQIRAGETVTALLAQHGVSDVAELLPKLSARADDLAAEKASLDAISDRTEAQNTRRSGIRKELRGAERDLSTAEDFVAISRRDRFDCWFIDDFPTVARIDPPEDVVYRSVPDEEAIAAGDEDATKVIRIVKDPVEGRVVNIFTYSSESIDKSINYLRANFAGIFDAITHVLRQSLIRVEVAFMQTPWPVVSFLFIALSWAFTGKGTTIFVASSLAFLAVFELWQVAMQTMALVVVATAICILVGLPVGIWMAKNKVARVITEPILDVMQTIPSLSYLVPAVAFFGISQPPAVIATVIFAIPPMVKLTALGIRQVPESTKEAALAFGSSERQLLRKVELPMAIPSIMAGLNQTIMLALSMATISAFIGAEGLGALVTASLGDAQAGKGLLAGLAIALVAMMIDRILKGIRASFSRI